MPASRRKTQQPPPPPIQSLITAVEDGSAPVILDEQAVYALAVRKDLTDVLFPPRPALDAAAVERLLKEGVLTAEDVLPCLLVKGPLPR